MNFNFFFIFIFVSLSFEIIDARPLPEVVFRKTAYREKALSHLPVESCPDSNFSVDTCKISIDNASAATPIVAFENNLFKAVIRINYGGACDTEDAIRDLIIKSKNVNMGGNYIDACAQRGPLQKASIIFEQADSAKIKLEYRGCENNDIKAISEYTFYKNSPFIKIDYIKMPDGWWNTVDIGKPGGEKKGVYNIYGQKGYRRPINNYPDSYWNTFDKKYKTDPKDGGALNYKGYIIMLVGNPDNQAGFGRIMPVKTATNGGIQILKLLNGAGFETFPSTGGKAVPYSGAIFVFDKGLAKAMEQAKNYIDKLN